VANTTNFTFSCAAGNNGQTYLWTAAGAGSMSGFTYTINQTNARTSAIAAPSTWPAATANCWITTKGGGC
jgi:type IV pilus assembly protein PilE